MTTPESASQNSISNGVEDALRIKLSRRTLLRTAVRGVTLVAMNEVSIEPAHAQIPNGKESMGLRTLIMVGTVVSGGVIGFEMANRGPQPGDDGDKLGLTIVGGFIGAIVGIGTDIYLTAR